PQSERRALRDAGTFADMAARYREHAMRRNKSWRQADRLVCRHLLPRWGKLAAASITRNDVRTLGSRIAAPVLANQVLASASAVFSWALREDYGGVTANPCTRIERNRTRSRERVLSDAEMSAFWKEFGAAGVVGAALKMILMTGQRPGEVTH